MGRNVLIVGATRGLGQSLLVKYSKAGDKVYGTARGEPPSHLSSNSNWIKDVDLSTPHAGESIAKQWPEATPIDILVLTAGYFGTETFDEPDWEKELLMYKTSAIGPVFLVHHLEKAGLLKEGSKIFLITSESGSIKLRHESEGGGNYGHHASKAAENMVGRLLSFDLKDKGVAVGIVHPGFLRTEMTAGVGFDKMWDEAGAVTPDEGAETLIKWIDTFDISKTGTYWAPRGPVDMVTVEATLGPKSSLPTPLELPW